MIEVYVINYGWGKFINYDPRFPGYFDVEFNLEGQNKIIRNLKKRDIDTIIETLSCEVLEDDFVKTHIIALEHSKTHNAINKTGSVTTVKHIIDLIRDFEYYEVFFDKKIDNENYLSWIYYEAPEDKYNLSEFLNFDFKYN